MAGLDDLIHQSASELSGPQGVDLDSLIHASAQDLSATDFSDVYSGSDIPGMLQAGNIDLKHRPVVHNPDGTVSTVRSISIGVDGKEVLIPTVSDDGKILSDRDAVAAFQRSGKHLGIFDSPESATRYAQNLHERQAQQYGDAISSTDRLPAQPAPPAPASLDPGFRHWYAAYVQNTGQSLSYDQARQLYKSLPEAQRKQAGATGPLSASDAFWKAANLSLGVPSPSQVGEVVSDYAKGVASGAKQGADFLAHIPDYAVGGIASIPFTVNAAVEQADRRQRLRSAITATNDTGEDYADQELRRQAENPIPQAPPTAILPDAVEGTFQSARDERERLAEHATQEATDAGLSPEAAALVYAIPQTVGNAVDPTMLLGAGEATKGAEAATAWLDRLIARGAEEELGPRAADAAEPALTRAVAPSEDLAQRFPGATIDAREYVEPPSPERRAAAGGQPLPTPPEGIQPGEPWLQKPIPERSVPNANEAAPTLRPEERVDASITPEVRDAVEAGQQAANAQSVQGQEIGPTRPSLTPRTPSWASSHAEAMDGFQAFADDNRGKWAGPDVLPFETDNLPITRWTSAPGEQSATRRGAQFYLLADSDHYFTPIERRQEGWVGGPHVDQEFFTPKNPVVYFREAEGPKGTPRLDNNLAKQAAKNGNDAILIVNNDSGNIEVVKTRLAAAGEKRESPLSGMYQPIDTHGGRFYEPQTLSSEQRSALAKSWRDFLGNPEPAETLNGNAGYRGTEDPLAPGAEGAGRAQPEKSLASGRLAVALPAGDRPVAEEAAGEPLSEASAPPREGGFETSLARASADAEREARGFKPIDTNTFGSTDETMAKAKAAVDSDPAYPRQLAQDLLTEDRPPRPHEVAELLYDKAKILNEEKAAMDALEAARASGDGLAEADAREALTRAQAALDANTEASRRGLASWGEAGRLSQQLIREDYSTSRVLQRARLEAPEGKLAPEVEQRLTDLAKRVQATSEALDAAKDQVAQMRLKRSVAAMERETAYQGRRASRAQTKEALDAELSDLSAEFGKKAATPRMGLDPELVSLMVKMAKNRVRAGVNGAEDVVDAVYQVVRSHIDGVTPRDVRDAISGYGQARKGSRDLAEARLAGVKREMRLLSKIEDAEAGVQPAKAGVPRRASPQIKAMEKRLRDTMRKQGLDRNMRLDAYRARLTSQKADLERQLATGDFSPVGRPQAVEDASTRQLRAEIEKLKNRIDTEVKKIQRANRTWPEKTRDLFLKWRRATLLSSTQTVGKLLSAAETRTLVTTPVEQLIGAGWSKVPGIRRIAAMAPREGTVSLRAEAKAWASAFSKETWKDAWETGAPKWAGGGGQGKGELDLLYGKKSDFPPEVLDFFGHLHAGLKTLAKRPEFERSLALRYEHAARAGIDTTLPEVQAEIAAKAYADANRAVLLQDNALVDGFRAFQGMLRNRGATGLAAATDFFLPIVKVPANYVAEAAEYGFGPMRALNRVIWKGGIEGLEEKDAEYIMRNLKKGTLGTSLLALGYYGYDKIGGYRQRNEHRGDGEVQPMTIRMNLFGHQVDIPHALLHAPALEMVQVGATLHRLQDAYADKGKEHGTMAGALAGTRGLLEQVPFYGELLRTQQGLESPTGFMNYAGNLARSLFLPPDVQRLANVLDQEEPPGPFSGAAEQLGLKHFEPVRRYPQDFFWDQFKVGIPWARGTVSDEKNP